MDRRALIRGLSTFAILAPTAGYAQTLAKAARVGLLMTTTPVAASHIVVAFADSLRAFGYLEGKNLILEYRWAEGRPERLDELVADLIRQRVDVIVASSQAAALAAKRATTTIPIVMVNATDPQCRARARRRPRQRRNRRPGHSADEPHQAVEEGDCEMI